MLRFEMVGLRYDRAGRSRRDAMPGPEVLHDLSFHVPAGAFRWLLGPSGAGKTSLLRLLYLAVRPTTGRLSLLGADVTTVPRRALPALRRRIGVVFQDFRLLPHLSTFDNVALPLRIAGRPEGQIRADVTELLRWVGLARYLDVPPAALSGGEQQRVAIARAVITRPALLLADEPTGNLDDGQAERLMQLFKELNRIGTTVIVATHNEALVARHPAPALRIADGRLVGSDRRDGQSRVPGPNRAARDGQRAGPDRGIRPERHIGPQWMAGTYPEVDRFDWPQSGNATDRTGDVDREAATENTWGAQPDD
jgi:cell division transport system ATP-binding protein